MKKIILAMGFGLFLLAFSMHLKTSVGNPLGMVTDAAMVHASGNDCPWGVEEVETSWWPPFNNNKSKFCDCTTVSYEKVLSRCNS